MHEGCNARAWVCLEVCGPNQQPSVPLWLTPGDVVFLSGLDQIPALANKTVLNWSDLNGIPSRAYDVFEALVADSTAKIPLYPAHNEILFYNWGDQQCCLPTSATRAVLLDDWDVAIGADAKTADVANTPRRLHLVAGAVLIFEEVKGPITGNPADADPSHRWPVRLTQVTPTVDPLIQTADGRPTPLVAIEWAAADALPVPFCLSARLPAPDCRIVCDISVARGNVVLVDNGLTLCPCEDLGVVEQTEVTGCCACEGSVIEMISVPGVFRPVLSQFPLTFRCVPQAGQPASKTLTQDPRKASPAITLSSIPAGPDGTAPLFQPADLQDDTSLAGELQHPGNPTAEFLFNRLSNNTRTELNQWNGANPPPNQLAKNLASDLRGLLETWQPQRDLLESGPAGSQFVVEMDDNGLAHLRFGDGNCGRQPDAGMDLLACYRIGNGASGNVGADHISKIAFRMNPPAAGLLKSLRNPLAAQGGADPEPVAEVKLFAPGAFKTVIERAITADDYATIAERNPALQRANAVLRWTGGWYEAQVAVDPLGSESPDETLLRNVRAHLSHFRRLGHDLVVNAAEYVPLQIVLDVCVLPQYLRGHVEAALLGVFSNGGQPGGQPGFFNPDNLTFGEGIYLSRMVAAAQAVTGVQSVTVTKFQRLFGTAKSRTAHRRSHSGLERGCPVGQRSEFPRTRHSDP